MGCPAIAKVKLAVERTASRRGGHVARRIVVVLRSSGRAEVYSEPAKVAGRGTYARGVYGFVEVDLTPGDVAVSAWLVRGPSGRVSGVFRVVDHNGREVLRAVYRKLKIRRSHGDVSYAWAVEEAVRRLGIERYVRRFNWRTGAS